MNKTLAQRYILGIASLATVVAVVGAQSGQLTALPDQTQGAPRQQVVAAAVPKVGPFQLPIDPMPKYVAETGCDPSPKPGAVNLQTMITDTYGKMWTNIGRACTDKSSGHEEGRAVDWAINRKDPVQMEKATTFINWLLAPDAAGNPYAMARRLGVMYIMWDSKRFYLFNPGAQWQPQDTCLAEKAGPEFDTYCHRDHVHISMTWEGARAQTTYHREFGPNLPDRGCLPTNPQCTVVMNQWLRAIGRA